MSAGGVRTQDCEGTQARTGRYECDVCCAAWISMVHQTGHAMRPSKRRVWDCGCRCPIPDFPLTQCRTPGSRWWKLPLAAWDVRPITERETFWVLGLFACHQMFVHVFAFVCCSVQAVVIYTNALPLPMSRQCVGITVCGHSPREARWQTSKASA
jgi:hypothetical protein